MDYKKEAIKIEKVINKWFVELGNYADNLEIEGMQNTNDYRKHCVAVIRLYGLVLEQDTKAACNLLRYMFSQ